MVSSDQPKASSSEDRIVEEMKREAHHLHQCFSAESDRGVALVVSAFFDATLERLLRAKFSSRDGKAMGLIEPLFEGLGPLATFSAKIRFAYAIDLLQDWVAFDLDLIRRIRNEFSHSFESATFANPSIASRVDELQGYERAVKTSMKYGEPIDIASIPKQLRSRFKFDSTCARIGALLQAKVIFQVANAPEEFKNRFMIDPRL